MTRQNKTNVRDKDALGTNRWKSNTTNDATKRPNSTSGSSARNMNSTSSKWKEHSASSGNVSKTTRQVKKNSRMINEDELQIAYNKEFAYPRDLSCCNSGFMDMEFLLNFKLDT